MANVSGLTRSELLEQARALLRRDAVTARLSDDALAAYVVEYAPEDVPRELRLRIRDLDVLDALKALRDSEA